MKADTLRFLSGGPRVWPGFSSSPLSCIQAPCFHSTIGSLSGQRSLAGGLRSGSPLVYLLASKAAPGPPPSQVVRAVLRRPRPGAFMPLHVRHGGRLKAVRVYWDVNDRRPCSPGLRLVGTPTRRRFVEPRRLQVFFSGRQR